MPSQCPPLLLTTHSPHHALKVELAAPAAPAQLHPRVCLPLLLQVLGLPLGAVAAFVYPANGLLGIWWGMTLAVYLHLAAFILLVFCPAVPGSIKWDKAAEAAAQRLGGIGEREPGGTSTVEPLQAANINAARVLDAGHEYEGDGPRR